MNRETNGDWLVDKVFTAWVIVMLIGIAFGLGMLKEQHDQLQSQITALQTRLDTVYGEFTNRDK